ncbi:hypothetical protein VOLCADRAFT_97113 [Volvox carteri f. nagariensis]|uniref:Uncharacterized protein n=1 Tax=Volvox carteri f. nagariensis TaxID=3068 RepID=D8UBX5_VOLCA|nr:uncharacterized protein VOLCADRAFT_97113 [Volvox carteri f. nagariensis]EFJ42748.1 hypothetical protein VOLCADRAFT_97113 [Volvox carteri f. nagariensis]|eukprot:XP_002956209.1 hypothetical protein VOLCADRAFT_97113 [Volvox carteri f. nagariensis]
MSSHRRIARFTRGNWLHSRTFCVKDIIQLSQTNRQSNISVNTLFADKLELYRGSLPEELRQHATAGAIAQHLGPILDFLHAGVWRAAMEHGFTVPEFGHLFEGEAEMLFGNISYVKKHSKEFTFEEVLQFLLTTLRSFDPAHLTSILTAYPVCRRAAMAIILEQYLTAGPFNDVESQLVANISQHLFKLHHRAAQTKRIIEFFHVSKSGGTSFCQLGRMNGCRTQSFETHRNCLITYFRFNFYANELVMHDHNRSWVGVHPCREFLNVVIFREPQSRVVSHMQNILKEYVIYYNQSLWQAFNPNSVDQWRTLAVPVFDNYVVRSLLGGQAYNMPYGGTNHTHLLAAKIVTLQFEVLLSLAPETSEFTRDIFGLGLGWQYDLRHMHVRPTIRRPVDEFSAEVMEAVRAAGRLDEQLYEFALVLQLLDAITFGIAHDVAGMDGILSADSGDGDGSGGDDDGGAVVIPAGGNTTRAADWAVNVNVAAAAAATAAMGAGMRRLPRGCGYVGVRRPPDVVTTDRMTLPPVAPLLEPYNLLGAEFQFALQEVGSLVVAGGRWFKREFYRNSTAALDAAAAWGRAKEAGIVASLAEVAAEAATSRAKAANATKANQDEAVAVAAHCERAKARAAELAEAAEKAVRAGALGAGKASGSNDDALGAGMWTSGIIGV